MNPTSPGSGAIRIGRLLGIELFVDPWIALPFLMVASSNANIGLGLAWMGIVFVSVLLHEYGHALAGTSCGVKTHSITLGMLGGVALLENKQRTVKQDLWITVAGPLVNVVLWLGCTVLLTRLIMVGQDAAWMEWLAVTAYLNWWLLLFNLIPAFPMDGGRILHGLLLLAGQSRWKALYVVSVVACIAAVGMGAWGLWDWLSEESSFPIFRLLIAWQVWVGARQRLSFLKQIEHTAPELAPGPGQI